MYLGVLGAARVDLPSFQLSVARALGLTGLDRDSVRVSLEDSGQHLVVDIGCLDQATLNTKAGAIEKTQVGKHFVRSVGVMETGMEGNSGADQLGPLLARISSQVHLRGLDLLVACRGNDLQRNGVISVARFSSTLGSQLAAIKLTADEIQLLVDRFRPAARTAWEAPLDEVDYAAFCSEVSPNTPGFVPVPDRWMHNNVTPQNTQLTETEAELLYEVLARFAELCQHRRLDLNGILRDYDSQRNGLMPTTKLTEAFSVCGIRIELREELSVLHKQYGTPSGTEFDYQELCSHVKSVQSPVTNPLKRGEAGPPIFR
eukprot:TRINITY_DN8500_c0_g1_i9.p2 TRINITY_DN8500_c0_g1~~TRINITY_DN8500_c0_g1_i9.p2  ORF type:complete len:316 (+),score=67.44 TRINITY_DN8500_c0_g1_i9:1165-2112(+)